MLKHPGDPRTNGHKLIISLEDFSGRWSEPYRLAGYEVWQVDLKHGSDARLLKKVEKKVHGVLCAPVCTALSGAGAKHWKAKEAAGNVQLLEGLAIVDANLRFVTVHKPAWWVMENPVGRLKDWIGHHRHTFNPNEYAGWLGDEVIGERYRCAGGPKEAIHAWDEDAYTKRTCLWGNFKIPKANERPPIHGSKMWALYGGKSERTKEMRSMTPRGFSRAFFAANP